MQESERRQKERETERVLLLLMVLSVDRREGGAKVEETKAGEEEGGRLDEEESGRAVSVVKGDVFEESVSLAEGVLSGGDAGCA